MADIKGGLEATKRDIVLAAVAAFVAALTAFLAAPDVTVPGIKAAAVAAGYAVVRAVVAVIAKKLNA